MLSTKTEIKSPSFTTKDERIGMSNQMVQQKARMRVYNTLRNSIKSKITCKISGPIKLQFN